MLDLPLWLVNNLKEIKCPNCDSPLKKECISGEGIMKSDKFKNRTIFFIIYDCLEEDCKNRSIIALNRMTMEEFATGMVKEHYENPKKQSNEEKEEKEEEVEEKSGISQEEIDEFKTNLNNLKYHNDFLGYIGLSKEEIDKSNSKGEETEDEQDK